MDEKVNNIDIDENENKEEILVDKQDCINSHAHIEKEKETQKLGETITKNVYDSSYWINIETSLRDLSVEKNLFKVSGNFF